jgi:type II secretory pathway component PulM
MSEAIRDASFLSRLGRWLAELILVFVGVYAAFWLNNYQQHQQEVKRRDQILAYLEQRLEDGINSAKSDGANKEKIVAAFKRSHRRR